MYATIKNRMAQFKHGDFSNCDVPCPRWPKTVTTPEIIDQVHELILEDWQNSTKSIAKQLGISREQVGSIIHEDLDMRKLSTKWVPKCLNADQKCQWCHLSEQILEFFRRDPNDFVVFGDHWQNLVISLWPGDKATINGVAAKRLTPPQKIPSAKICWKSSCLNFLGSWWHPPHWLSSKGPNYQHGVLLMSAGATETFWRKNAVGRSPRGSCSCMTMPWLTGHLQPRRNWPTWDSNALITHPILWIWPRPTTTCSLNWKNNWKVAIFHATWRSLLLLVGRTTFWIFFELLANVRATG